MGRVNRSPWAVRSARERSHTMRHQELLDAAARVFAARGYDGTTVADITAEADVSRATMYVYFSSKEEIFAALAAQVRDAFLATQQPEEQIDDPRDMLAATVRAYAEAVFTHGRLLRVIAERAAVDADAAELHREISEPPLRRFTHYLDREARAGRVAPVAAHRVVAETVATTITHGVIERLDAGSSARQTFIAQMLTIALALVGLDSGDTPEEDA